MKICCFLIILALSCAYAKSIGDVPAGEQKEVQPNPIEPSIGQDDSALQAQKDNQRKLLEAMFKIAQGRIAMQMWDIFNS